MDSKHLSSFLFSFKVWLMLLLASLRRLKSLVSHVRKKTNYLEGEVMATFSHETPK